MICTLRRLSRQGVVQGHDADPHDTNWYTILPNWTDNTATAVNKMTNLLEVLALGNHVLRTEEPVQWKYGDVEVMACQHSNSAN